MHGDDVNDVFEQVIHFPRGNGGTLALTVRELAEFYDRSTAGAGSASSSPGGGNPGGSQRASAVSFGSINASAAAETSSHASETTSGKPPRPVSLEERVAALERRNDSISINAGTGREVELGRFVIPTVPMVESMIREAESVGADRAFGPRAKNPVEGRHAAQGDPASARVTAHETAPPTDSLAAALCRAYWQGDDDHRDPWDASGEPMKEGWRQVARAVHRLFAPVPAAPENGAVA